MASSASQSRLDLRVTRELTRSSKTVVSLATLRSTGDRVVVKTGKLADLKEELLVLQTVAQISGVVRLIGTIFGTSETLSMVFEFCPSTMHKELKRRAKLRTEFGDPEIVRFAREMARALTHVHKLGVVHADIKLENILIDKSGRFLLADFGNAFFVDRLPEEAMRGSLLYLAPEMFKAQFPTPATDVWSLGVCVAEITLLRAPFDGLNPIENILTRRLCGKIPITRLQSIRDFVGKCLNLDPRGRASAESLADCL